MKHLQSLTKQVPAMAQLPEIHPDLLTSVKDFLEDPAGTIDLHLDKSSS